MTRDRPDVPPPLPEERRPAVSSVGVWIGAAIGALVVGALGFTSSRFGDPKFAIGASVFAVGSIFGLAAIVRRRRSMAPLAVALGGIALGIVLMLSVSVLAFVSICGAILSK